VAGLLALDEDLSSTGKLTWSPAKSKDWSQLAHGSGFLGARAFPEAASPAFATPLKSPAATLVEDMSPPAENVERMDSNDWMRESIVRDLMLLRDEEHGRKHVDECMRRKFPPTSPVPEEVSVEHGVQHEDSDVSVAATTPACGRSASPASCSSYAASPDCEAILEQDCVAGYRKTASPQEAVSAVAHGEAVDRIQHFTNEPSGSSFPVFHYAKAPQSEATSAARPHVSTAATGAVRTNHHLPQRQLSAPSQRSPPEAPRSFRCSPSPTQVQPFSHDSARSSPGSASKAGDNVVTFGKNKYVVGGRHGVAPWQEKAAPRDPAQHNALATPVATMAEARKASHVVGSNLNMLLRLQARGGIKGPALKAHAGATGAASAKCRPPSIPTSSQCANMNANLGGLGVGGMALGAKSLAAAGERGKMMKNLEVAPSTGVAGDTLGMMSGNGFSQRDPALARVVKRSTAPNRVCAAPRAPSAPSAPAPSAAGGRR
jgi:hypothetical protein